jgi:hypothetical protein
MNTRRYNSALDFVLAILAHLPLLLTWPELALWRGPEHEAWKLFQVGAFSAIGLVSAGSILRRGNPQEKVTAFFLTILPALHLLGVLVELLGF